MSKLRDNSYAFNRGLVQSQDNVSEPKVGDSILETKKAPKPAKKKAAKKK